MLDKEKILELVHKADKKRDEANRLLETTPTPLNQTYLKRVQYIQSHLELLELVPDVGVVAHLQKVLPEYLWDIEIAKEYGKYYYDKAKRYAGEVEELNELLDK